MDIEKALDEEEKSLNTEIPSYEKTWKDTWKEWSNWISKLWEWRRVPLTLLFSSILSVGAILMYLSIYSFTKNMIVSILSVAFTEAGIVAWEFSHERIQNTATQLTRSKFMRTWHIVTSVVLLMTNLAIETATSMLDIKIDGAIYIIFGVVGLTSFLDIWNYFYFQDNDKQKVDNREHAKRMNKILVDARASRLDSLEKAEQARSKAESEKWEELAPKLAKAKGEILAAKKLKDYLSDSNLTEDEVQEILRNTGMEEVSEEIEENEVLNNGKRPYRKTGKYSQKQSPQPMLENKNSSFSTGETPKTQAEMEAIEKLKTEKSPFKED